MNESTHNQIMISSLLYFITILSSFWRIKWNECVQSFQKKMNISSQYGRLHACVRARHRKSHWNQIYIDVIFHRYAFVHFASFYWGYLCISLSLFFWLLFDFKGKSIVRQKLCHTNILRKICLMYKIAVSIVAYAQIWYKYVKLELSPPSATATTK